MRITRTLDGAVHISRINEWELRTLRSLPGIADPGEDEAALRRLYPAPFQAGEATDENQEDWAELVQPELEQLFESSLERVADDVKTARLEAPSPDGLQDDEEVEQNGLEDDEDEAGAVEPEGNSGESEDKTEDLEEPAGLSEQPPRWELTIPAAHVEDWYRAMNQARLMLSTKHEAHRRDDEHITRLLASGRIESLIQDQLLTAMCGWWVEVLMQQ